MKWSNEHLELVERRYTLIKCLNRKYNARGIELSAGFFKEQFKDLLTLPSGTKIATLVGLSNKFEGSEELSKNIAMQVAAMNPKAISKDDDNDLSDDEILESQAYIRDASKTVGEVVKELSAKVGENIVIMKINRFEIGS